MTLTASRCTLLRTSFRFFFWKFESASCASHFLFDCVCSFVVLSRFGFQVNQIKQIWKLPWFLWLPRVWTMFFKSKSSATILREQNGIQSIQSWRRFWASRETSSKTWRGWRYPSAVRGIGQIFVAIFPIKINFTGAQNGFIGIFRAEKCSSWFFCVRKALLNALLSKRLKKAFRVTPASNQKNSV